MRKNLLKILMVILSISIVLGCVAGCGGAKPSITLAENAMSMVVYEDFTLTYEVKNYEGDVEWASSDDSVVSVLDGVLTAKKVGTATITASITNSSASCVVTVSESDYAPDLIVGTASQINLLPNGTYNFSPRVTYKGSNVQATFEYESNDTAVATVSSNGQVVAVDDGDAVITITANFKGTEIIETVTVVVRSTINSIITSNDEPVNDSVSLEIEGDIVLDVSTLVNGVANDQVEVEWSTEDDSITITQTANSVEITGVGVGTATLKATFTKGMVSVEREIAVSILKKTVNNSAEIFIDKGAVVSNVCTVVLPAEVNVNEIESVLVGEVEKQVVATSQSTNSIQFDVSEFATGEVTLKFETSTRSYTFINTTIADMVIKTKADLTAFGQAMLNKTTDGKYYVLGANIDYENGKWAAGWPDAAGDASRFGGTLDGRGYKISNFNTRRGLVYATFTGSVIKNLIIDSPIVGSAQGGVICLNNYGTIENCAIITKITKGEKVVNFAAIARHNGNTGVIKNCVAVITEYNVYDEHIDRSAIAFTNDGSVADCYSISASSYFKYLYASETAGVYFSAQSFLESVTELPEENGWNKYWSISSTQLTFNGMKIA